MTLFKILRFVGWALIALGTGSAIMRTQMDMDTILTNWMGQWQPWSGIIMAVTGAVCVTIAILGRAKSAQTESGNE